MAEQPLCLLALDGGGIRGLTELLILKEIMVRIQFDLKLDKEPIPADFFDLIGGTSTGGLIALLLGRVRLPVSEALQEYINISRKVFEVTKHNLSEGRFRARNLEKAPQS
ncbi:MAG: hypothetical protein M1834_002537 [Cirrosporium novae-zelandiae]|nr:MAG: hypothetical protein M1834_002537 [Cirrosporium novae-zelandiae]